jgi:hypothetical protein
MILSCVLRSCGLVNGYRSFRRTHCLYFKSWRWKQFVSAKRWYLHTGPNSVTTKQTNMGVFTALRTSNLIQFCSVTVLHRHLNLSQSQLRVLCNQASACMERSNHCL